MLDEGDALALILEWRVAEVLPSAVFAVFDQLRLERVQVSVIKRELVDLLIREPSIGVPAHCRNRQRLSFGA